MKNKIISIIQNNSSYIDQYLHYNARLAKDFGFNLEFVNNYQKLSAPQAPHAIVGSGIPKPVGIAAKDVNIDQDQKIQELVKTSMGAHDNVNYTIHQNGIESRMQDKATLTEAMLWTISQESEDTFLNQLFGTTETELTHEAKLPTLTIPQVCTYVKPKTMVMVIRNTPQLNFSHLLSLKEKMGLRIVYVFHEDENDISINKIMHSLGEDFKNFEGTFKTISLDHDNDALDKVIGLEKPEWIAFANYDRSLMERIYKPNTNHFILSSKLPILNF